MPQTRHSYPHRKPRFRRGHAVVSLVMAVLMALWSPLWCCCWLSGGIDAVAGASTTEESGTNSCAAQRADSREAGCPMCLAAAAADDDGTTTTPAAPTRPACHCHDQSRDTAVLKADLQPVFVGCIDLPPLSIACESFRARPAIPLLQVVIATTPSPPPTLVRLHTLLLT